MSSDLDELVAFAEEAMGVPLEPWQRRVLGAEQPAVVNPVRDSSHSLRQMAVAALAAWDREVAQQRSRRRRMHHAYRLRRKGKW